MSNGSNPPAPGSGRGAPRGAPANPPEDDAAGLDRWALLSDALGELPAPPPGPVPVDPEPELANWLAERAARPRSTGRAWWDESAPPAEPAPAAAPPPAPPPAPVAPAPTAPQPVASAPPIAQPQPVAPPPVAPPPVAPPSSAPPFVAPPPVAPPPAFAAMPMPPMPAPAPLPAPQAGVMAVPTPFRSQPAPPPPAPIIYAAPMSPPLAAHIAPAPPATQIQPPRAMEPRGIQQPILQPPVPMAYAPPPNEAPQLPPFQPPVAAAPPPPAIPARPLVQAPPPIAPYSPAVPPSPVAPPHRDAPRAMRPAGMFGAPTRRPSAPPRPMAAPPASTAKPAPRPEPKAPAPAPAPPRITPPPAAEAASATPARPADDRPTPADAMVLAAAALAKAAAELSLLPSRQMAHWPNEHEVAPPAPPPAVASPAPAPPTPPAPAMEQPTTPPVRTTPPLPLPAKPRASIPPHIALSAAPDPSPQPPIAPLPTAPPPTAPPPIAQTATTQTATTQAATTQAATTPAAIAPPPVAAPQPATPPQGLPLPAAARGTSALAQRLGVRRHEPSPLPTLPDAARTDGALPAARGTSVLAQRLGLRRDDKMPPPAPSPAPSPEIVPGPNPAPGGQRLFGKRSDMPRPGPPAGDSTRPGTPPSPATPARVTPEPVPVPRPPLTRPSLHPLQPNQALPRMRPMPQIQPNPPRRRRRLLPAFLMLALLVAAGTATAWRMHLLDRPAAEGAVNAPRIAVVSPADGRVTQVLVAAGAQVEPSTEMFIVDAPPPDQRRRADLASRLDNAHARADRLDRQITEMTGILNDLKSRPTDPSSTRQQDDIRLRLIDTRAQRDSANSEAHALEQTIAAESTRPSGRQSVKAGSAGLVWSLAVTEAMEVSRGMPLAELADCTRLSVVVNGTPDSAKKLLPGQPVRLRIAGFGQMLPGIVRVGTGTMPRDEPAAAGNAGDTGAMLVELDQATQEKLKNSCPVGRTVSIYADGG